jgi:hypothetical protein
MRKLRNDDGPERLKQLWLAYEYPGRMVLRDLARLRRFLKRAYAALTDRNLPSRNEEESENHLWAERRK